MRDEVSRITGDPHREYTEANNSSSYNSHERIFAPALRGAGSRWRRERAESLSPKPDLSIEQKLAIWENRNNIYLSLKTIWDGDQPLAVIFWGHYVFVCLFLPFVLILFRSNISAVISVIMILGFPYLIYLHIVWRGMLKSSSKYQGPRIWRIFARVIVVLHISCSIIISVFQLIQSFR